MLDNVRIGAVPPYRVAGSVQSEFLNIPVRATRGDQQGMTGLLRQMLRAAFVLPLLANSVQVVADTAAGTAIGPERCARNRAAGPITFLTSFAYAATSGILDVLAARELGYFDALCLKLAVEPGSTNAQLVSAGTAQLAGLGDASSVLVAIDNGAAITGVLTYGNTSAIELITLKSRDIKSLSELAGKTIGYKVAPAPQIAAMLVAAHVPIDSVNFVSVGFNPATLANGNVAALIAYKSNEPRVLASQGYRVTEWDPEAYGIHSTFNVLVANKKWAAAHPTAVQDFLRATLRAFNWINLSDANLERALGFAQSLSTAGFDLAGSRERWKIEARLIAGSQPANTALGHIDDAQWQPEADMLVRAKLVSHAPVVAASHDNSYLDAIYDGKALKWPAP
jgi:ABC-type nitrate/sulfonate/bicarbonate transport system substrate-binding protein